jgi:DNA invertase Pin-like site-specific DNA recombinase
LRQAAAPDLGYRAGAQAVGVKALPPSSQPRGLGLEAQRKAVKDYLNGGAWQLLREYVEVESGKRNDRPELAKAIAQAQRTNARLVITRFDRLSRNAASLLNLMES